MLDRFILCMMHSDPDKWTDRIEWEAWEGGIRHPVKEGWRWIFVTQDSLAILLDEIEHGEHLATPRSSTAIENLTSKGGAPPKADWPALEEAFLREVKERGVPELLNVEGWQRQADVERWIAEMLDRENIDVSETTIRGHARKFLSRARGQ